MRHSRDFNEEVSRLRVFNHANLLPVLTVVNQPPQLMLISQFMPNGSLFDVLHADTGARNCVMIPRHLFVNMHTLKCSLPKSGREGSFGSTQLP